MKKLLYLLLFIIFIPISIQAKHLNVEKHYQDIWCSEQGGVTEVIMEDGTRCDCLTDDRATEVDFASKFYEGIAQALHYSMLVNLPGGLLLIIEKPSDWKFVKRAKRIIKFYSLPITVFTISPIKK